MNVIKIFFFINRLCFYPSSASSFNLYSFVTIGSKIYVFVFLNDFFLLVIIFVTFPEPKNQYQNIFFYVWHINILSHKNWLQSWPWTNYLKLRWGKLSSLKPQQSIMYLPCGQFSKLQYTLYYILFLVVCTLQAHSMCNPFFSDPIYATLSESGECDSYPMQFR